MLCSKCKELEAVEGQRYCKVCHAAYMREYRRTVTAKAIRQAGKVGAERFRESAIRTFQKIGSRELNGLTAAAIVERINT